MDQGDDMFTWKETILFAVLRCTTIQLAVEMKCC